jgi:hypothetical protein
MRCGLPGKHFSAVAVAQVDPREDQQIHEATAEEIARSEIRVASPNSGDIDREFGQRRCRRQRDAPDQHPAEPGRFRDRVRRPGKSDTSGRDDSRKREKLEGEMEHQSQAATGRDGATAVPRSP